MPDVLRTISERLEARLIEGKQRGQVIGHNLEYGLGAEMVVRTLMREMMPIRYGIGKGKLINRKGESTRHLDLIIYDQLNLPTLFLDEHQNQILPIESAYGVIEIKSRTTASVLKEAFENLASVAAIAGTVPNCSTNELVDRYAPCLTILSLEDEQS